MKIFQRGKLSVTPTFNGQAQFTVYGHLSQLQTETLSACEVQSLITYLQKHANDPADKEEPTGEARPDAE